MCQHRQVPLDCCVYALRLALLVVPYAGVPEGPYNIYGGDYCVTDDDCCSGLYCVLNVRDGPGYEEINECTKLKCAPATHVDRPATTAMLLFPSANGGLPWSRHTGAALDLPQHTASSCTILFRLSCRDHQSHDSYWTKHAFVSHPLPALIPSGYLNLTMCRASCAGDGTFIENDYCCALDAHATPMPVSSLVVNNRQHVARETSWHYRCNTLAGQQGDPEISQRYCCPAFQSYPRTPAAGPMQSDL